MKPRKEPAPAAIDDEQAAARARFRHKLATAESRMTAEKRAKARKVFGLDSRAA